MTLIKNEEIVQIMAYSHNDMVTLMRIQETMAYKMGVLAGRKGFGEESNLFDPDLMPESYRRFELGRAIGLMDKENSK